MKVNKLFGLAILLIVVAISSCDKSNSETEFIADDNTFADFNTWMMEKTFTGPDSLLQEMAHINDDSTVTRKVYFKNGQNPVNGKYPTGTLIVKHSYNSDKSVEVFTALAKRGNGFNPKGNDWEFFMLNPDGSILVDGGMTARGANLMDGMCYSCHLQAADHDFVFSK